MSKLAGKVAVITGASKGIGAGIAKTFAAEGAAVVVNYASSKADADRIVGDITRGGGKAIAVQGDMTRTADVRRLFAETKSTFGKLDVLVNNAGVYSFAPLASVTPEDFHHQFDVNVLGTILATQQAANYFGAGGGSVINVSSIVSVNPMADMLVYAASKSAVDSVTRSLAKDLSGRHIRVNAIAPGATETEGLTAIGAVGTDLEKALVSGIPMGRLGKPDDIARVALFLASDESSWVTGERITASGGQR